MEQSSTEINPVLVTETIAPVAIPGTLESAPHPVYAADRIKTIDIIRGVALFGILLMNIPYFGIDTGIFHATLSGPHSSTDFKTMQVVYSFFDGTMRGLFSMLFGAGMVLFTMNKKEVTGGVTVAEYYYRRLLWLVAFGLFNAFVLLWWGDILFFYGLIGMLLYPFRKASPKWLMVLGLCCIGIGLLKQSIEWNDAREKRAGYLTAIAAEKAHKKLTHKQEEAKEAWLQIEKSQSPDTARIAKNIRDMRSDYGTVFSHLMQNNTNAETWGMYHGLWDMLSMMFFGMALLSWGFFSNKLSTGNYVMWLLVGFGFGIPLGWFYFNKGMVGITAGLGAYVDAWRVPHFFLYDFRRFFLSLAYASALILIYRSGILNWLMKALACVGQMAFSNYLMQSIICTLIFHGYGLSYYNRLAFHQLYYIVAAVWIFQLIFSVVWLRYFRFGPFEWLWRSLTYWKKQPMKVSR